MTTGVSRDQLQSLQGLRGLAASLVVFEHLHFHSELRLGGGLVPEWFAAGHLGVDLFFVLSGFILLHVHRKDLGVPGQTRRYVWRRFVRIWPLLALLNTLKLLYIAFGGPEVSAGKGSWGVIISSYLCLTYPEWPLLDVAWTLRHEVLFYALFALAVAFGWRLGLLLCVLAAAALGSAGMSEGQADWPWWLRFLLSPLHWHFLFGLGAAWLVQQARFGELVRGRLARPVLLLALVVAAGLMFLGATQHMDSGREGPRVLFALGAALLVCALVALERRRALAVPRWLTELGDASYSLYLWHGSVIAGVLAAAPHLPRWLLENPTLLLSLVTALAFASSYALYRYVERPMLRALRR
jgi:exopolysaccharide production protein ExoZ